MLALAFGAAFAADPRIEQGAIFEAKGEYEMALGEYRAILAEQPQNSEAYFLAAEVYVKTKNYSRALANYRLAYKFAPTMSKAYEGAAKVYELMGQKAKADEERLKDPKNRPVEEAPVQQAEAPAAPAEPVAEAKPAEPKPAPVETKVPETKAAEPVKTAEPVKPTEPVKAAEPAKATPEAKPVEPAKAEAATPTDPFEKGKVLLAAGKYSEAAPLWREVLAKKPGDKGAYFYAGVTRYYKGEYDKAEINLKKGIEYKEEGNDANYYLALVYQKTKRGDLEKKSLAAYLKKAAPDAKFRRPAEDRLAEMKAVADSLKVAEAEKKDSIAKAGAVEPVAAAPATPAPTAVPAASEAPVAEGNSIANANLLFKAGSFEAALQMYKALLNTPCSRWATSTANCVTSTAPRNATAMSCSSSRIPTGLPRPNALSKMPCGSRSMRLNCLVRFDNFDDNTTKKEFHEKISCFGLHRPFGGVRR